MRIFFSMGGKTQIIWRCRGREVVCGQKTQLAEVGKARQIAEAQLEEITLLPQKILATAFEGAAWS